MPDMEEVFKPDETMLIQEELQAALFTSSSRLGNAFRNDGPMFSGRYNNEWAVESILSGTPKSSSRAISLGCRGSVNTLLSENDFSPATVSHLKSLLAALEENIRNEATVLEEERVNEATSKKYEEANVEGVYVYSFPTFLRVEQMSDPARYWFKVGMTETSAFRRVREQTRQTGLPEDPVIYRVFQHPTKSPKELEQDFHNVLTAAGHDRANGRISGTEWFQTNLDLLDALAGALGCTTPHVLNEQ